MHFVGELCQNERKATSRDAALLLDEKKQREMQRLTSRKKNAVLTMLTVTEHHAAQSVSLLIVHGDATLKRH